MKERLIDVHVRGVKELLERLAEETTVDTVEVGQESFKDILLELFQLRAQNRALQARGAELLMENRDLKREVREARALKDLHIDSHKRDFPDED